MNEQQGQRFQLDHAAGVFVDNGVEMASWEVLARLNEIPDLKGENERLAKWANDANQLTLSWEHRCRDAEAENEQLRAPGMTIRCHRCLRVVNRDEGDGKEQRWRWTGDDEDRECLCVDCDPEGVAADEALNVERTEARKAWFEQLQARAALADDLVEFVRGIDDGLRTPGRVTVNAFASRWLARYDAATKPSSAGVDTEGSEV